MTLVIHLFCTEKARSSSVRNPQSIIIHFYVYGESAWRTSTLLRGWGLNIFAGMQPFIFVDMRCERANRTYKTHVFRHKITKIRGYLGTSLPE